MHAVKVEGKPTKHVRENSIVCLPSRSRRITGCKCVYMCAPFGKTIAWFGRTSCTLFFFSHFHPSHHRIHYSVMQKSWNGNTLKSLKSLTSGGHVLHMLSHTQTHTSSSTQQRADRAAAAAAAPSSHRALQHGTALLHRGGQWAARVAVVRRHILTYTAPPIVARRLVISCVTCSTQACRGSTAKDCVGSTLCNVTQLTPLAQNCSFNCRTVVLAS